MALWRLRTTVEDRPGYLSLLTASLALRAVNILSVNVHLTEAGAVDDLLVDAPDELTERELCEAIARGRGRSAWVAPAQAHRLVDAPTRALDLATLVVREPAAVPEALAELLDAEVAWEPESRSLPDAAATDPGPPADTRLRVPAPGGAGWWVITRAAPAFTPAEYAQAQALLAAAAAGAAGAGAAGSGSGTRAAVAGSSGRDLVG